MRILHNPWFMTAAIICFTLAGCESNHQTARAGKTSQDQMKFNIIERDSFTVMGTLTRVATAHEDNETYIEIWKKFMPFDEQLKPLGIEWWYYGVEFPANQKNAVDYLAGRVVRADSTPPDAQLVVRKVPAARYAVFKCPYKEISKTRQCIFNDWLPGSRYKLDTAACVLEQYQPRDRENKPVLISIPIKNK